MKMKHDSHTLLCAVAGTCIYYALELSRGDRSAIDWAVIGLLSGALVWNVAQLGRQLHLSGGARALWHLGRTALFWTVGIFNTALIRPEDAGGWRSWLGWTLILLAVADTVWLARKERQCAAGAEGEVNVARPA